MCRHIGWLGQPRSLASLILEPPHSLLVQSYAPRRQTRVRMNADGWGVGFFTPGIAEPARWRSTKPLWADGSVPSMARHLSASCIVAAVRAASPGMPIDETATAPFTDGHWLLSHNGVVDRSVLPLTLAAESVCDSALLAAHVFSSGPQRLGEVVASVGTLDPEARLNLLVTDGRRLLATTWGDTLSYLVDSTGIAVASEPYDDDPRWIDVPDRHLVDVTPDGVVVTTLESSA
jgi:glutamine amidotransferase